jgi:hypothetical protein
MGMTLVEGSKLSTNILQQGVVETIVKDDPILNRIRFKDVVGNALTYNRESTVDGAEFYGVNAVWNPTNGDVTPATAYLRILGSAGELDDFIRKTRSNINDVKAEIMTGKAKAVQAKFADRFIYGNATTNPLEFDGLHICIASSTYNTILADADDSANHALSCNTHLDKLIDMVKGRKPEGLLMSKGMRRAITKYLRSVGAGANADKDEFGMLIERYNGLPIWASDYLLDTEATSSGAFSAATGGATTSIFALNFQEKGVEGLQCGPIEVLPWAPVPLTNKEWCQIRWYPSIMMQSLVASAKVVGIDADGTVGA